MWTVNFLSGALVKIIMQRFKQSFTCSGSKLSRPSFLPKSNLHPSLGVQERLWGPQKSKNKPVTASFLMPKAVKDPAFAIFQKTQHLIAFLLFLQRSRKMVKSYQT